ncbi:MAG: flagellar hook-associated protein 3 [Thermodesulfovibrio sp.]|nr:flagellar hook-associated protein 3 [Thermodesulfovibrio sp.]
MRVTEQMQSNMIRLSLQNSVDELARSNNQLMSGKKAEKPSDDVLGTVLAMDYRVSLSAIEQFKSNIDLANVQISFSTTTIESVSETLTSLYGLVRTGSNTLTTDQKISYSQQAEQWRDMLLDFSNNKLGGKYIFSGYQTGQPAFAANPAAPALPLTYDYNGDNGSFRIPIDKGVTVPVNIQGSRAFSPSLPANLPTALGDGTVISYASVPDVSGNGVNNTTITIGNFPADPGSDQFTASNYMEMANILSFAWKGQNVDGTALGPDAATSETMGLHRVQALAPIFSNVSAHMQQIVTDLSLRKVKLDDEVKRLTSVDINFRTALSKVEDADINQVAVDIKTAQVALDAIRTTAAKILSQSIFDFLR